MRRTYRKREILQQLLLELLHEEEEDLITDLCIEFENIFYIEGDQLSPVK